MGNLQRTNKSYALRVQKLTKNVTVADLTAAATSQKIAFDEALPADAFVFGAEIDVTTPLSGGGAASATADLGENVGDADGYIDGANVFTGASTPVSHPRGVQIPSQGASVTPAITVAANVNVNLLTAGDITATVYYFRKTQV